MNWDQVEGNWKQFKGKVKEQWGKLTDDHIDRIAGRRDQLAGRIQESYGILITGLYPLSIIDKFVKKGRNHHALYNRSCSDYLVAAGIGKLVYDGRIHPYSPRNRHRGYPA